MQNTGKQNYKFPGEEMKTCEKDEKKKKKGGGNSVKKNGGKMKKEYHGFGCTCLKKNANDRRENPFVALTFLVPFYECAKENCMYHFRKPFLFSVLAIEILEIEQKCWAAHSDTNTQTGVFLHWL